MKLQRKVKLFLLTLAGVCSLPSLILVHAETGDAVPDLSRVNTAIRYVKPSGTGNGTSWERASGDLQLMIDASGVQQVWVAGGTYQPIRPADSRNVIRRGNRDNAFVLKSGVKVYGGFAGTEAELGQRDLSILANASILSGDLDNSGNLNNLDAFHVVIAAGNLADAELNGFSVRGGNANGGSTSSDVIQVNNHSIGKYTGGGIVSVGASPVFENLTVEDNYASSGGGVGIHGLLSPRFINVTLSGNRAGRGGGILANHSSPVLINVTVSGNRASSGGGICSINSSSPVLTNVLISGNYAAAGGGGIVNTTGGSPILTHVTISGNSASYGGGIYNESTNNRLPQIFNSVIFGNSSAIEADRSAPFYVGRNNIIEDLVNSIDPLFVNAPSFAGTPFTGGDYRLKPCSPAINAGDNTLIPEGILTDLQGNP